MRMKNIKLRGNKKEMLLLVDQNTKLEKGMCEGDGGGVQKLLSIPESAESAGAEEISTRMEG